MKSVNLRTLPLKTQQKKSFSPVEIPKILERSSTPTQKKTTMPINTAIAKHLACS